MLHKGVIMSRSAVSRYRLLLLFVVTLATITCLVAGCGPNNSGNSPKPAQSTSQDGY